MIAAEVILREHGEIPVLAESCDDGLLRDGFCVRLFSLKAKRRLKKVESLIDDDCYYRIRNKLIENAQNDDFEAEYIQRREQKYWRNYRYE